ncbi:uncharacterized protein AMSG_06295 [Thecamonas trahens ATCC 50062]|uniref:Auto-transporter adhesin head GIN domain-containing protein n=1 Tax=Thecamonas trahens ATCC 50062 TaxID=461836 RepID=A0A0L0DCV1_THETB|nr:hypothetical protein AMSG_06295 [Thecamonas trahens ATCC 50062]KNC50157.1 hypothetical protein AMSG_06295 [Thecamonas trahens ATCC 50062]|eukprot:XP_013757001.1 hypothetical protein AMSG_06295 [Thecamonas trahens ATCC 50062]
MQTQIFALVIVVTLALAATADELTFCNYAESGGSMSLTNSAVTSETTGNVASQQCATLTYTPPTAVLNLQLKSSDGTEVATKAYTVPTERSDRRVFAVRSSSSLTASFALETLAETSTSASETSIVVMNAGLGLTGSLTLEVGSSSVSAYLGVQTTTVSSSGDVAVSAKSTTGAVLASTTISSATIEANRGKTLVSVLVGSESSAGSTSGSTSGSGSGSGSTSSTTSRAISTRSNSYQFKTTDSSGNEVSSSSAAMLSAPNAALMALAGLLSIMFAWA